MRIQFTLILILFFTLTEAAFSKITIGVVMQEVENGIKIIETVPDGAAHIGGIRENDVVLSIGNKKVNKIQGVITEINKYEGKSVFFEIIRGDDKKLLMIYPKNRELSSYDFKDPILKADKLYENRNYKDAVKFYKISAEQGSIYAQYQLGKLYSEVQGATQNYGKAKYWYEKAAKQGIIAAQINLGTLYLRGNGATQNYGKAKYWYEKAAKQGSPEAQNNMGVLYFYGLGVIKNHETARYWYKKSAEQGFLVAQNQLDSMNQSRERVAAQNGTNKSKSFLEEAGDWIYENRGPITAGIIAVIAGTALSSSNYCFRPNGNCSSSQEKKHKKLHAYITRNVSNKRSVCASEGSFINFLSTTLFSTGLAAAGVGDVFSGGGDFFGISGDTADLLVSGGEIYSTICD